MAAQSDSLGSANVVIGFLRSFPIINPLKAGAGIVGEAGAVKRHPRFEIHRGCGCYGSS